MTTGVFNYRTPEWRKIQEKIAQDGPPTNPVTAILKMFADKLPAVVLEQSTSEERRDQLKLLRQALENMPEAEPMIRKLVDEREAFIQQGIVQVEKPIANGRLLVNPSFDTNGFMLVRHLSAVTDWTNEAEVRNTYYPEVTELVKQLSGASLAICNSHIYRRSGLTSPIAKLFNAATGPIRTVHNDFTSDYHAALVRLFEEADDKGFHTDVADFGAIAGLRAAGVTADRLRNSRLVVFNTWRNTGNAPVLREPLAVADNRTVSQHELIPTSIGGDRDRNIQGLGVYVSEHNPHHQFYYMPKMTKEEVLIFKTYDSSAKPFIPTLHTAFDDPQTPDDAPQRTSLDARVLCVFPKTPSPKL